MNSVKQSIATLQANNALKQDRNEELKPLFEEHFSKAMDQILIQVQNAFDSVLSLNAKIIEKLKPKKAVKQAKTAKHIKRKSTVKAIKKSIPQLTLNTSREDDTSALLDLTDITDKANTSRVFKGILPNFEGEEPDISTKLESLSKTITDNKQSTEGLTAKMSTQMYFSNQKHEFKRDFYFDSEAEFPYDKHFRQASRSLPVARQTRQPIQRIGGKTARNRLQPPEEHKRAANSYFFDLGLVCLAKY